MAKTVVFLFHNDDASLNAGSHVAERIRQVASDVGVELEVFCFGPAQSALTEESDNPIRMEYKNQIDSLASNSVRVSACLNAATASNTVDELTKRGIHLEFARDAFARYGLESASVISF